jgi:hypothetical protein
VMFEPVRWRRKAWRDLVNSSRARSLDAFRMPSAAADRLILEYACDLPPVAGGNGPKLTELVLDCLARCRDAGGRRWSTPGSHPTFKRERGR